MEDTGRSGETEYQKLVTVDGDEYKLIALPPSKAFRIGTKLIKLVGEPISTMALVAGDDKGKDKAAAGERAAKAIPVAVRALLANLHEEEMYGMIRELLGSVEYDKKLLTKDLIEVHFQKRLGHMVKVVTEVVRYQFEDFFDEIGQAISSVMENL